jgi:hypothetical protein
MSEEVMILKYRKALAKLADMYVEATFHLNPITVQEIYLMRQALVCLINENQENREDASKLLDKIVERIKMRQVNDVGFSGVEHLKYFFDEYGIDISELFPFSKTVL